MNGQKNLKEVSHKKIQKWPLCLCNGTQSHGEGFFSFTTLADLQGEMQIKTRKYDQHAIQPQVEL